MTFGSSSDSSTLKIAFERPAGTRNNFLVSAKTVGASVWVTECTAMQSQTVAMETVIGSHYVFRSNNVNRSGGGTWRAGRS